MGSRRNESTVTLSILDRLSEKESDGPSNPWQDLRDLKLSLCRDLAALLNTRRKEEVFDPPYEEAANSVLTYGIPDYTSYNLTNGIEQEMVRRSIERAIRQFEPRLAGVSVSLEEPNSVKPTLRFQIDAVLKVDASESVAFDISLHRDSRRMAVAGADRD